LKVPEIFRPQQIVITKLKAKPSVAKAVPERDLLTLAKDNPKSVTQGSKRKMKKITLLAAAAIATTIFGTAFAENPMVGGAAMYPNKNIVQNALNSKDHTTLVAAVKAGGLVETLEGKGPFTVFAPTYEAFAALPAGTVDTLLKPENKKTLDKVLTYHVVPGKLDTATLDQDIKKGGGKAELKTVEGGTLTVSGSGKNLMVMDEKGATAKVTIADVMQSNGVILVVDKVLIPN
jgi:uncharacterized surface protein with fasciclin (FAS1) repeats